MNDDLSELERDLRRLRPRSPNPRLPQRIALALDQAPTAQPSAPQSFLERWRVAFVGWGMAAAAAAGLALAGLRAPTAVHPLPRPPLAAASLPPREERESFGQLTRAAVNVYEVRDEGVVFNAAHPPVRQVRYRSVDTLAWRDARSGVEVEISYPCEEVVRTPVSSY